MPVKLSFITPAKNTELFIAEMIDSVRNLIFSDWELIIIDDNSEDDTFRIAADYAEDDKRIKIFKNIGEGKVSGLNLGYSKSSGEYVKFIDSDDTLTGNFNKYTTDIFSTEVTCHDYNITDEKLNILSMYPVNKDILIKSAEQVSENLISLARAMWICSRNIADKIFPLPEELPFEDVWFSLVIKNHTDRIQHIPESLYNYRQHENQTFGGVLNFSRAKIKFRGNRMVRLIKVLESCPERINLNQEYSYRKMKIYYSYLASGRKTMQFLFSRELSLLQKIKGLMFCNCPWLTKLGTLAKWRYDKFRAGISRDKR